MEKFDFFFKAQDSSFFVYVQYPDEGNPRYMINSIEQTCSCKGWAIRQNCKHIDEFRRRLKLVGDKIKDMIVDE